MKLQKINKSYRILKSVSITSDSIHPIVETHSSTTSRIYYKNPSLQNLAKKYRNIFIPSPGKVLSYADYDQFEVGIMASISGDEKMKALYVDSDAYTEFSKQVFGTEDKRKYAKVLFLSYSYGMLLENILKSVEGLGGNRKEAEKYFNEFSSFENWKTSLYESFVKDGKISTLCGNSLKRKRTGELSAKEMRSVVSHVVQGTGSYIFKSALLEISKIPNLDILIPIHDAVLVQHPAAFNNNDIVSIIANVMSRILNNKIIAKASLETFSESK